MCQLFKRKRRRDKFVRFVDIGSGFITSLIRSDMWIRAVKCQQDHTYVWRTRIRSVHSSSIDLADESQLSARLCSSSDRFFQCLIILLWLLLESRLQIICERKMCYAIRSRKSILMIQIDWVELSLLSNKTRLVLSSADDSQHERHILPDATITAVILDIDTCLLDFEEKHKRSRSITWAKSRSKYVDIHLSFFNHRWCTHTHRRIERVQQRERERTNEEKEREIWSEWAGENNVHLIPSSLSPSPILFI